jgi:hypothetical protein
VTDAERLVRAIGPTNVRRLLKMAALPGPHTWDMTLILGPIRGKGRRSVELVTTEQVKTLDEVEVEAHTADA